MMSERNHIRASTRWVVKIGTSLLTDAEQGLKQSAIASWVAQINALREQGLGIVLVCSGSIGEGMRRLGWVHRPGEVHRLQTAAAVGQMGLVHGFENCFHALGILTAQILLTHADLANRQRYLNVRNTLRELLAMNVTPIVNENDAVVNEEIRFGDNDTLAALTANLIEAEYLIILTDQAGLYESDPRTCANPKLVTQCKAGDPALFKMAGTASTQGSGGMVTKVRAAQRAAGSGARTVIVSGKEAEVLCRLKDGEPLGTLILPGSERIAARKQWLAGQLRGNGILVLDQGAVRVLRDAGKSLLPIGVVAVEGKFSRGDIVTCVDVSGNEIGRGLVNYHADEARKIMGSPSNRIESILGYSAESELIHRDNIALTA